MFIANPLSWRRRQECNTNDNREFQFCIQVNEREESLFIVDDTLLLQLNSCHFISLTRDKRSGRTLLWVAVHFKRLEKKNEEKNKKKVYKECR